MLKLKALRNLLFSSILAVLLMGCSETPPDENILFTAITENSEITNFYNSELIKVVNIDITNQWVDESSDTAIFFYDYTVYHELTRKGVTTLSWTASSVAQQGKNGVKGQIALYKKGEAWYVYE